MIFRSSLGRSLTVIVPEYCKRWQENKIIRAKVQLQYLTSSVHYTHRCLACWRTLGTWHLKKRPLGTRVISLRVFDLEIFRIFPDDSTEITSNPSVFSIFFAMMLGTKTILFQIKLALFWVAFNGPFTGCLLWLYPNRSHFNFVGR